MVWIAGSTEGAARALSGRERGWGVAGCIMGMPECRVIENPPRGAVRLFAGGAGAAASDTYVTINEVKKVPIRIRAS